ncbi:MAG: MBL fold metallo-hydrolase [Rhodobacteraceae bacterium]|nr:MBL fold metallo-hydrolase [Paracoccaceae bacterium]
MTKAPQTGIAHEVAPGVRSVLAPNPSPMTHWGTNTYLVGEAEIAVIDPGPDDAAHLQAVLSATRGQTISHILVTHAHLDHAPLAARLAARTGAQVMGFGAAHDGRSTIMAELAAAGHTGGGEGVDSGFQPHTALRDTDTVQGADWALEVVATPGHFSGHLSFAMGDILFSGDHVMGWSSTLISPPDGDVRAFMSSCARLQKRPERRFLAGHGAPIDTPAERLEWLIAHRLEREAQILNALGPEPQTIGDLAAQIYSDIPPRMLPVAARNLFAHLIDLTERNLAVATPELGFNAGYCSA